MCDENGFCKKNICIEDFCGRCEHGPIQFWADWCPTLQEVSFGGAWWKVPSLHYTYCPTIEELDSHIQAHDGYWWRDRAKYHAVLAEAYAAEADAN